MTGHDIVAWRNAHNWNQRDAAETLGITRRTIQRWEASTEALPAYVSLACAQVDAIEAAKPPPPEGDTHKQLDWLNDQLQAQKPRIIGAIKEHGPLTRQEIADITGIALSSVCARVSSLINRLVLEDCEKPPGVGRHYRNKVQVKAKAAQDAAHQAFQIGETQGLHYDYLEARKAFIEAAEALGDELIAERFHEAEGD